MICIECRSNKHELCPANKRDYFPTMLDLSKPQNGSATIMLRKPPTGLSPEGDAIQLSGLCACHHKPWPAAK